MQNLKMIFSVAKLPFYAVSLKNGRKTFEIEAFDGELVVSVIYDYERKPLSLRGEITKDDVAEIILMDHRIELYVNGILKDEEWPCGKRLFAMGDAFLPEMEILVAEYAEEKKEEPCVLSSFENAEGWYPGGGVFVGDCMPYRRDNEYHVMYLRDRHHHASKWTLGGHQWEHISTKDFKTWNIHPMAIPITDPDEGSICTGSWIRENGREYLYYTLRLGRGLPAPICRSVSEDGYHFVKDHDFHFTITDRYSACDARDPKVVKDDAGVFHMFLTTGLPAEGKGCLAHYVSCDMETWEDAGAPIYVSPTKDQPECPDYLFYKGKYYLIFSLRGEAHYMISDQPFKGFHELLNAIIPCESVPKGAIWDDKLVFAGFRRMGGYAGSMTFKAATALPNGELLFEEL